VPTLLANEAVQFGKALVTDCRVPGRLLGRHAVYEAVSAEQYVIDTVAEGYRLEFDSEPPPSFVSNNKSARDDPVFVRKELMRLEQLGCLVRVESRPKVVLPLSRVYSNKWRLVVDASRGLNPYCTKRSIKLEDLTHVCHNLKKGDFMVCNDLDSGYWHVPIHPDHWTYLGVHQEGVDGEDEFWVWKVLCLGLRDAAHIFTRLLRPLMAEMRKRGMRGQIYIDDKWTLGRTFSECLYWEGEVKTLFQKAGWVFKPSKRSGDPSQVCQFLGLVLDSRDLTFNIPPSKIEKIQGLCRELIRCHWVLVRRVASLVGLLQSVRLATGPIVAVLTRSLYYAVAVAPYWSSYIKLDCMAVFELKWWASNIVSVSKYPVDGRLSSVAVKFEARVASDGSGVGHFCYDVDEGARLAGRAFTAGEQGQSSTFRELLAFKDTWTDPGVLVKFQGKHVTHFTDSKAMASIVMKGSRNPRLQPLVLEAVLSLREHGITMESAWLSREDGIIKLADYGSRDYHADDISVDFDTFTEVVGKFGWFDIDCFASSSNKKATRYFSRYDVLGSSGVDFFLQKLRQEDNHWLFPPLGLLCKAVWHLQGEGVTGVILVPVWPASSFFTFFWPDGRHAADWVEEVLLVKPHFICSPLVTSRAMRGRRPFQTAVMKVDFTGRARSGWSDLRPSLCLLGGCSKCI
jgi:hypothetical protein